MRLAGFEIQQFITLLAQLRGASSLVRELARQVGALCTQRSHALLEGGVH